MKKDEFISYMKHPGRMGEEVIQPLAELLEDFPFFQTAHLLYLKVLHDQDHIRFDAQLRRSALFVADRRRLHALLHEEMPAPTETVAEKTEKESSVTEEKEEKKAAATVRKEKETVPEPATEKKKAEKKREEEGKEREEKRAQQEQREEQPKEGKKEQEKKEGTIVAEPVVKENRGQSEEAEQKKRITHAGKDGVTAGTSPGTRSKEELMEEIRRRLQEIGKTPGEESPERKEEEKATAVLKSEGEADTVKKEKKESEKEGEEDLLVIDPSGAPEEPDVPEHPTASEVTDDELLEIDLEEREEEERREQKKERKGEEVTKKKKVTDDTAAVAFAFSDWLSYFDQEGEEPSPEKESRNPEDEIIDRFLERQPRIVPRTREQGKEVPDERVERIVEESGRETGLFTETLAKIYLQQGYYTKAIHVYEKLSLKYPEKSSYFAARIKEVEQILRDQTKKG